LRVTVAGAPAPPELMWRKHIGLLIYLTRSPRGARTRDHLIGTFWPDKAEAAARHSLNEALRILRRVLGPAIDADAEQVRLAKTAVALDLDAHEDLVARGEWAAASALALGPFLEGFDV